MSTNISVVDNLNVGLEKAGVKKRGRNPLVADKTGYSPSMVAKILSGHAEAGDRFIKAVCTSFGIREEWVLEGKEPVLSNKNLMKTLQEYRDKGIEFYNSANKPLGAMNADQMKAYAEELALQEKITSDMFNPLFEASNNRQAIIAMLNTLTGPQIKTVLKFISELISKETE